MLNILCLFQSVSALYLHQRLSQNFGLADSATLAARQAPGIFLSLYSQLWDYIMHSCTPLPGFLSVLEESTPRPPCLCDSHFTGWAICLQDPEHFPTFHRKKGKCFTILKRYWFMSHLKVHTETLLSSSSIWLFSPLTLSLPCQTFVTGSLLLSWIRLCFLLPLEQLVSGHAEISHRSYWVWQIIYLNFLALSIFVSLPLIWHISIFGRLWCSLIDVFPIYDPFM